MRVDRLNEEEIIAAYHMAQKMYSNGNLPQRRQLINLYVKQVLVYPEYVEIEFNNIPTNLLKAPVENEFLPTVGNDGENDKNGDILPEKREMSASKMRRTRNFVVEANHTVLNSRFIYQFIN